MGIDIYMRWKGQTEEQRRAQFTGFSVRHGHVGYLREAYHGKPYATEELVPEAFAAGEVPIPAAVMRQRLPGVMETARRREVEIYHGTAEDAELRAKAFQDFVELAERMEAETGEPVRVTASY